MPRALLLLAVLLSLFCAWTAALTTFCPAAVTPLSLQPGGTASASNVPYSSGWACALSVTTPATALRATVTFWRVAGLCLSSCDKLTLYDGPNVSAASPVLAASKTPSGSYKSSRGALTIYFTSFFCCHTLNGGVTLTIDAACAAGTFGMGGFGPCAACAPGTLSLPGAPSCAAACPAGSTPAGSGACACGPGRSPVPVPGACTSCPAGWWSSDGVTCQPCAPGYATPRNGSTSSAACLPCAAGAYAPEGSSACLPCKPGYFSSLAAQGSCTACAAGRYNGSSSATSCAPCRAGEDAPLAGSAACAACLPGTFADGPGFSSCTACAAGRFNNRSGSTAPSNCLPCANGTSSGSRAGTCCVAGYYSTIASSYSSFSPCTRCPAGAYCAPGAQGFEKCPVGTYNRLSGSSSALACLPCLPGSYAAATGAVQCTLAAPGAFAALAGASSQRPCFPGSYQPLANSTACVPCAVGSYLPNSSSTKPCLPCPRGSFCPPAAPLAAPSTGQYAAWPCPAGYFGSVAGLSNATCSGACTAPPGFGCAAGSVSAANATLCPRGLYCPGGSPAPALPCTAPALCNASGLSAPLPCLWAVRSLAGNGSAYAGLLEGVGSMARFRAPKGVAVRSDGTAFLVDAGNSVIRKVTPSGATSRLAGGSADSYPRDGTGVGAYFSNPTALALHPPTATLFTADECTVRAVASATGVVTTVAGSWASCSRVDGVGPLAAFNSPQCLAFDATAAVLFVAEVGAVRKVALDTYYAVTLVSSASAIGSPTGLAADGAGSLYFAAAGLIKRVSPTGAITAVAGGVVGFVDAAGTNAAFSSPQHLAFAADGALLVADGGNSRIRLLALPGAAGNASIAAAARAATAAGAASAYADSYGTNARFRSPFGLAAGAIAGAFLVSDSADNRLRTLQCAPCPESYYCAPSVPMLCPAGAYCPVGSALPTPCPWGTSSAAPGAPSLASCQPCAPNTYAASNASACEPCPAATFSVAGAGRCCGLGNASAAASAAGPAPCVPCPPGHFSGPAAVPLCQPCPQGTFSSAPGAADAADACQPCQAPPGSWCPAGSTAPQGQLCPQGRFCAAGGAAAPQPCSAPPGAACPAGSTQDSAAQCPAGFFCEGGAQPPQPCPCAAACAGAGASAPAPGGSLWLVGTVAAANGSGGSSGGSGGSGGGGGSASGAPAPVSVGAPTGLAVDPDTRSVVLTDGGACQCVRVVTALGEASVLAGGGQGPIGDGQGAAARFSAPAALVLRRDGSGEALVADSGNGAVRAVARSGAVTTLVQGLGTPCALALSAQGVLYVVDAARAGILSVLPGGTVSALVGAAAAAGGAAGWGSGACASVDGPPALGQLCSPRALGMLQDGALLVAEGAGSHRVRRVGLDGSVTTIAGSAAGLPGYANGVGSAALFSAPSALALDAAGAALFLADAGNNRVRRLLLSPTPPHSLLTSDSVGGSGAPGSSDGVATSAQLTAPSALALDVDGTLYVAASERLRTVLCSLGSASPTNTPTPTQTPTGTPTPTPSPPPFSCASRGACSGAALLPPPGAALAAASAGASSPTLTLRPSSAPAARESLVLRCWASPGSDAAAAVPLLRLELLGGSAWQLCSAAASAAAEAAAPPVPPPPPAADAAAAAAAPPLSPYPLLCLALTAYPADAAPPVASLRLSALAPLPLPAAAILGGAYPPEPLLTLLQCTLQSVAPLDRSSPALLPRFPALSDVPVTAATGVVASAAPLLGGALMESATTRGLFYRVGGGGPAAFSFPEQALAAELLAFGAGEPDSAGWSSEEGAACEAVAGNGTLDLAHPLAPACPLVLRSLRGASASEPATAAPFSAVIHSATHFLVWASALPSGAPLTPLPSDLNVTLAGLAARLNWVAPDGSFASFTTPRLGALCAALGKGSAAAVAAARGDCGWAPLRLQGGGGGLQLALERAFNSSSPLPLPALYPPAVPGTDWVAVLTGDAAAAAALSGSGSSEASGSGGSLAPPGTAGGSLYPPASLFAQLQAQPPALAYADNPSGGFHVLTLCLDPSFAPPEACAALAYYGVPLPPPSGNALQLVCAWGAGDDCAPCPRGALCPGGYTLLPLPGFWAPSVFSNQGDLTPCAEPGATARCPGFAVLLQAAGGGALAAAAASSGVGGALGCGKGYRGDQCLACASGYYPLASLCVACPSNLALSAAVAVGSFAGALAVLGAVALYAAHAVRRKWGGTLRGSAEAVARLVAFLWLAAMSASSMFSVAQGVAPASLAPLFGVLTALQFKGVSLPPACFSAIPFQGFWAAAGVVGGLSLCIAGALACKKWGEGCCAAPASSKGGGSSSASPSSSGKPGVLSSLPALHRQSSSVAAAAAAACACLPSSDFVLSCACTLLALGFGALVSTVCEALTCTWPRPTSLRAYLSMKADGAALRASPLGAMLPSSLPLQQLRAASEDLALARSLNLTSALFSSLLPVSVLASEPFQACQEGAHAPVYAVGWALVPLFVLGYPALLLVALSRTGRADGVPCLAPGSPCLRKCCGRGRGGGGAVLSAKPPTLVAAAQGAGGGEGAAAAAAASAGASAPLWEALAYASSDELMERRLAWFGPSNMALVALLGASAGLSSIVTTLPVFGAIQATTSAAALALGCATACARPYRGAEVWKTHIGAALLFLTSLTGVVSIVMLWVAQGGRLSGSGAVGLSALLLALAFAVAALLLVSWWRSLLKSDPQWKARQEQALAARRRARAEAVAAAASRLRLARGAAAAGTAASADGSGAAATAAAAAAVLAAGEGGAAGAWLPDWAKELLGMDEDVDEEERSRSADAGWWGGRAAAAAAAVRAAVEAADRQAAEEEERAYLANPLHAQGPCSAWDARDGRVVFQDGEGGWPLLPGWQRHREGARVFYRHAPTGATLQQCAAPLHDFPSPLFTALRGSSVVHLDGSPHGGALLEGWVPGFEAGTGRRVYTESCGSGRVSYEAPLLDGLPAGVDAREYFECVEGVRYFWSDGRRTPKPAPGPAGRGARLLAAGWRRCVQGDRVLYAHTDGRLSRRPDYVH